ncbi:hypothetical protein GOBAR_AA10084 [Gossypium barbadense]|uniref:Adaptor protein ClpS core domain-containing protein n=1 Tax=Gossypium barbadense TaxID=3634 RepID=A0A2P5Y4U4_GOSBA|nr:hypothetical protein GOBAR_AA10084 [Gossypium barbadense]
MSRIFYQKREKVEAKRDKGMETTSSFGMVKLHSIPSVSAKGKTGLKLMSVKVRADSFKTGGAGVLERPSFDQSQFDPSSQALEVAKVLPQVVPSVTPNDARKLFHVSREHGLAVVIVTVKEHAEFYSQMMVRGGLRSTIVPDSDVV